MTCARFLAVFGVVALFVGCSGEGAAGSKTDGLPAGVADKAELETYECNMDVVGEKVYVEDLELNYECDGEKWFEFYDQTKPKSSSSISLADSKTLSSSSRCEDCDGRGVSCSASESASSLDEKQSSSSEESLMISSSSLSMYSSCLAEVSSSSIVVISSSATLTVLPPGKYDCSVYNCMSTDHLNPDVEYGELLDERDNQVYRTVKIGNQIWMAQNLNFATSSSACLLDDSTKCSFAGRLYAAGFGNSICPAGWHVPDNGEWDTLFVSCGGSRDERYETIWNLDVHAHSGWQVGNGSNKSGFSAIASGSKSYNTKTKETTYNTGDFAYFWSSSVNENGYRFYFVTGYYGNFLRIYDVVGRTVSYSIRCIKDSE
ncbi:FISUMP domain-containing protein [Fibrobacter succinogenes]|uniref:FISUMP domain-containing protein n=1 Tax=Fibrobacter succinogenes TaxID=833 RepID=UPI0013D407E2|nr:FISUMP domain-containing protein [Fibrobacter succinogenes]